MRFAPRDYVVKWAILRRKYACTVGHEFLGKVDDGQQLGRSAYVCKLNNFFSHFCDVCLGYVNHLSTQLPQKTLLPI